MEMENSRIKELEAQIRALKAEDQLKAEIDAARCPLCGGQIKYKFDERSDFGTGHTYQKLEIICVDCGVFGVQKSTNFHPIDREKGRVSTIMPAAEWQRLKRFIKP